MHSVKAMAVTHIRNKGDGELICLCIHLSHDRLNLGSISALDKLQELV